MKWLWLLNSSFNGTFDNIGTLNVTRNGQAITLEGHPATGATCSYPGTLTQSGQMAAVDGSYTCSGGEAGTFRLYEMQVNRIGLSGRFTAFATSPPGCSSMGWFGGLQVTAF
jgi:hypothetical protein